MNNKGIVYCVIAVTIAIIMAVVVLIPVIDDTCRSNDTFTNTGYFYLDKVKSTDTLSIEYDYTDPSKLTVNDVEFTIGTDIPYDLPLTLTEDSFLRFQSNRCTLYTSDGSYAGGTTSSKNLTIEASNGTMTITVTGNTSQTHAYTDLYVISENGAYVMKKSTDDAYILKDTDIFGAGRRTVGTSDNEFLMFSGSVDDGVTFTTLSGLTNTFTTPVINKTAVNDYVNLYKVSSITTTATNTTGSTDLTYDSFVVPVEISAERATHPDSTIQSILSIIPILVIVSIIIATASFIYMRK